MGLVGVLVVLFAYAALCVVARLGYRVLLYPGTSVATEDPPPGATMLTVRSSDGAPVRAVRFAARSTDARTFVVFHGNGETTANGIGLAEALRERGFGVVLAEYRGYGASRDAGRPDEQGLYRDAEALLDALRQQGIGPDRVVLMGQSLGTGVAVEMARRGHGAALVLVSPYTSITAMAHSVAPLLPAWACPDKYDTIAKAPDLRIPTLVIHGDEDEVVPFAMGRAVAAAIRDSTLHVVSGGHHNDLFVPAPGRPALVELIARHGLS
jgi:pimeloyl-ACP methyl ester carboxylesterase